MTGKEGKHSRDEQVRQMSKQEDIFREYLLQTISTKTKRNTMVAINQCQLEVFLLIISLRNIEYQTTVILQTKISIFHSHLIIVHSVVLTRYPTHKNYYNGYVKTLTQTHLTVPLGKTHIAAYNNTYVLPLFKRFNCHLIILKQLLMKRLVQMVI